jgi:hypothetical protein
MPIGRSSGFWKATEDRMESKECKCCQYLDDDGICQREKPCYEEPGFIGDEWYESLEIVEFDDPLEPDFIY